MQLFEEQSRTRLHLLIYVVKMHETLKFLCRMVLEWCERKHEYVERVVQGNIMAQQDLRACILYKFWCLGSLRDKPRLLQLLVDYWDPDT